jgi:hypothetical protein
MDTYKLPKRKSERKGGRRERSTKKEIKKKEGKRNN